MTIAINKDWIKQNTSPIIAFQHTTSRPTFSWEVPVQPSQGVSDNWEIPGQCIHSTGEASERLQKFPLLYLNTVDVPDA